MALLGRLTIVSGIGHRLGIGPGSWCTGSRVLCRKAACWNSSRTASCSRWVNPMAPRGPEAFTEVITATAYLGWFCYPIHEAGIRRQKIREKQNKTTHLTFKGEETRTCETLTFKSLKRILDSSSFVLLFLSTSIHEALGEKRRGNRSLGRWAEDRNINPWNPRREACGGAIQMQVRAG